MADINNDVRVDVRDVTAPAAAGITRTGPLSGDCNGDHAVDFREYLKLIGHLPRGERPSGGRVNGHGLTYRIRDEATVRTHAAGLVLGRLQPRDSFVGTHQRGSWVFGYVKRNPTLQGWVLRSSLPKTRTRASKVEMKRGGPAIDFREKAGIIYRNRTDRLVMRYLQRFLSPEGAISGYTTVVAPKDPTKPIPVYANFPAKPSNALVRNGRPVMIPAGRAVPFRFTPDGRHATIFYGPEHVWALVRLDDLNVPAETVGASKPPRPIRHR